MTPQEFIQQISMVQWAIPVMHDTTAVNMVADAMNSKDWKGNVKELQARHASDPVVTAALKKVPPIPSDIERQPVAAASPVRRWLVVGNIALIVALGGFLVVQRYLRSV
jgi:hypothetical protein